MKYLKIAEIGMTHDGSFGPSETTYKKSDCVWSNVVKFQWHIPEFETTYNAPTPYYFKDENRYEYFLRTQFTDDQFAELHNLCNQLGAIIASLHLALRLQRNQLISGLII